MEIKKIYIFLKYKLLKIKENQWYFKSHNGAYSDNSKYISETIHRLYPHIHIVWSVKPECKSDLPSYCRSVNYGTQEDFFEKAKSKVIIDNVYCDQIEFLYKGKFFENAKKRAKIRLTAKNQLSFGLWHGTPLKKIGKDQIGNDNIVNAVSNKLTVITGDDYSKEIIQNITFGSPNVKALGMARNDILLKQHNIPEIKSKLGIPVKKKVLLFAPTFRCDKLPICYEDICRSGINQLAEINIDDLQNILSSKFGGEWVIICRFHYHVSNSVDWNSLSTRYPIINGNISDDMSEYLCCADIVLTDYSSVMFDFALTKKPCFIFANDLYHYQNEERGFYLAIEKLPFSVAQNFNELKNNIMSFKKDEYEKKVEDLLLDLGNHNSKTSCEKIAEYIFEKTYHSGG